MFDRPSLPLAIQAANLPLAGFFPKPLGDDQLESLLQRMHARRRAD
jgi:hypothetical protein